ncbi:MAG: transposase [Mycoplasma sp.]
MTQAEKKLQKITEKEKLAKVQEMMDLLGIKDLEKSYKQMTNAIFNRALEGEMEEYMGYDKWDQHSRNKSDNYRNSYSKKKIPVV